MRSRRSVPRRRRRIAGRIDGRTIRRLDIGSGGGIPGLVVAERPPGSRGDARRPPPEVHRLPRAVVAALGLRDRVTVRCCDTERLDHRRRAVRCRDGAGLRATGADAASGGASSIAPERSDRDQRAPAGRSLVIGPARAARADARREGAVAVFTRSTPSSDPTWRCDSPDRTINAPTGARIGQSVAWQSTERRVDNAVARRDVSRGTIEVDAARHRVVRDSRVPRETISRWLDGWFGRRESLIQEGPTDQTVDIMELSPEVAPRPGGRSPG